MKSPRFAVLVVALFASAGSAAPVVPGLANKHPLTEPQVGRLLIGDLRCTACHPSNNTPVERAAPDLAGVGARVVPDYLRKFIAAPSAAHGGTTMPDLLWAEPADRRDEIAEALTHFLVAQAKSEFERQPVVAPDAVAGKALFHSVGCVTCHAPRDDEGKELAREGAVELGHVTAKYSLTSLGDFLIQPTRVRPSGRMPDMKLTPVEAKALANYLLGKAVAKGAALQPQANLVALGKEHFQRLNCAACHKLGDATAAKPVGALEGADATKGCLSDAPGMAPRFALSADQTKAIRAALAKKPEPPSDKERLAVTLTAFNCIGCHKRDDYGGTTEDTDEFFKSSEKELGDEGRIPPPLTLVGAKLKKVAMKKVLFDGDGVRPYMATRMPQFGEPNLRHLPDLFAGLDSVKKVDFSLPKPEGGTQKERDREREMRAAGRELVGDQGLNCIACHSFNGKTPGKAGIELLTSTERIQPAWFYHFLRAPNAFRPRTVMPTAWPGGQAVQKKILNGDTDRQIEAIWYYLSLGTSAQDPSGVRSADTLATERRRCRPDVPRTEQRRGVSRDRGRFPRETELRIQRRNRHALRALARRLRASEPRRARVGRIQPRRTAHPTRTGRFVLRPNRREGRVAAAPGDDEGGARQPRPAVPQEPRLPVQGVLHGRRFGSDIHVSQRRHRDRGPLGCTVLGQEARPREKAVVRLAQNSDALVPRSHGNGRDRIEGAVQDVRTQVEHPRRNDRAPRGRNRSEGIGTAAEVRDTPRQIHTDPHL